MRYGGGNGIIINTRFTQKKAGEKENKALRVQFTLSKFKPKMLQLHYM